MQDKAWRLTNRQNLVGIRDEIRDLEHAARTLLSSGQDKKCNDRTCQRDRALRPKDTTPYTQRQAHLYNRTPIAVCCKPCKHFHSGIQQNEATSTSHQLRRCDYRMGYTRRHKINDHHYRLGIDTSTLSSSNQNNWMNRSERAQPESSGGHLQELSRTRPILHVNSATAHTWVAIKGKLQSRPNGPRPMI